MGSPGWLDRYIAGKRAEVWHELRQLGAEVREPDVTEEAQAVCDQMAMRARQNIETIVARLTEQGYRFHTNDDEQKPIVPHYPPSSDAPELAAWFQVHFGRVPLTLLSWVRLVGDVWLVGTHPLWTASASADPLVIEVEGTRYPGESMRDYFEDEHQAHQLWTSESAEDVGPFMLPSRLTASTRTTSAAGRRTASSSLTAARTGYSRQKRQCPSCPTSTGSLAMAASLGAPRPPSHGRSARRSPRTFYPSEPLPLARR